LRREGLVHRVLWRGESKGLQVLIIASNYDAGKPPTISVEFRECCMDQSDTPPLPQSPKPLRIRIGLTEEPRQGPTISRVASDLAKLCDTTEDSARRVIQGVRARNPERGSQEWWIDPQKTPVHYTQFVFLVYLKRANLLQSDEDEQEKIVTFLQEQIFRRRIPQWCESPGSVVIEAFDVIVKKYSLPKRWNSLTSYLRKTVTGIAIKHGKPQIQEISYGSGRSENSLGNDNPDDDDEAGRDVKAEDNDDNDDVGNEGDYGGGGGEETERSTNPSDRTPHDLEITVDMIATHTGFTRKHIYCLARQGKIPSSRNGARVGFTTESLETAKKYAAESRMGKNMIQKLVDHCGKTKGAASKLIQRKKKQGMSLENIAREAVKERDRQS